MGQTKFGEASGWNAMKDKAVSQAKGSPGGKMFFGGLGKGLARGPMRMAGLFGGLFGRGKGKKRFGLF